MPNQTPNQVMMGMVAPGQAVPALWTPVIVTGLTRTLQVWEHVLLVTLDDTDPDAILTLPDIVEACGHEYFIKLLVQGGTGSVSFAIPGTPVVLTQAAVTAEVLHGAFGTTIGVLGDAGDYVLLRSNGYSWIVASCVVD